MEVDFSNIKTIGFDADDTLWVNETYFRDTEEKFAELLEGYETKNKIDQELFKMEMANLDIYGYGIKGFMLSMIESALDLSNNKVSQETIAKIAETNAKRKEEERRQSKMEAYKNSVKYELESFAEEKDYDPETVQNLESILDNSSDEWRASFSIWHYLLCDAYVYKRFCAVLFPIARGVRELAGKKSLWHRLAVVGS